MKLKTLLLITITAAVMLACNQKTDTPQQTTPKTLQDSLSYAWGYNIGRSFIKPLAEDSISVNNDMIILGLKHSASQDSTDGLFPEAQIDSLVQQLQAQAQAKQEQKMQERQKRYEERTKTAAEDAKKFLAENKTKPNIKEEKPNIQYRIITEGNGAKPKAEDVIKFHLVATFIDGEEIQSSRKMQPIEIPMMYGSPDMQALFKKMPVGSTWEIFWPAKLAYGEEGIKNVVPAESVIRWEVELLEIVEQPQTPQPPPQMPN